MRGSSTDKSCKLPEAQAIRLAQRGDAGAFEQIYRAHSSRVYGLCLRMLKNTEEAQDSTQDVFLQVFRKIRDFRGDSQFSTWLHRVAVNTVLMRLRVKKPVSMHFTDGAGDSEKAGGQRELGGPDARLEGYVDRVILEKAIAQLPPRSKLMFVLFDIQGYAHREIAKLLGCSVGNAKSQLHKARVRLREFLLRTGRGEAAFSR